MVLLVRPFIILEEHGVVNHKLSSNHILLITVIVWYNRFLSRVYPSVYYSLIGASGIVILIETTLRFYQAQLMLLGLSICCCLGVMIETCFLLLNYIVFVLFFMLTVCRLRVTYFLRDCTVNYILIDKEKYLLMEGIFYMHRISVFGRTPAFMQLFLHNALTIVLSTSS